MSSDTKIEWATHTFNPWWGCTKVSPLCDHCYAESWDNRWGGDHWGEGKPRRFVKGEWGKPAKWNREAEAAGVRARVFCMSMGDIFEKSKPCVYAKGDPLPFDTGELRRRVLEELIPATPNLDWLLLTKRIGNAESMVPESWRDGWPSNAWAMASVGNQAEADRDIPKLLRVPASVRGLSMEPLLGPVQLPADALRHYVSNEEITKLAGHRNSVLIQRESRVSGYSEMPNLIHWVIVGGESGHGARPMHPDWARSIRDQCVAAGVAYFFKQWGNWTEVEDHHCDSHVAPDGGCYAIADPDRVPMRNVGKKAAGRLLDGREWSEFPSAAQGASL